LTINLHVIFFIHIIELKHLFLFSDLGVMSKHLQRNSTLGIISTSLNIKLIKITRYFKDPFIYPITKLFLDIIIDNTPDPIPVRIILRFKINLLIVSINNVTSLINISDYMVLSPILNRVHKLSSNLQQVMNVIHPDRRCQSNE